MKARNTPAPTVAFFLLPKVWTTIWGFTLQTPAEESSSVQLEALVQKVVLMHQIYFTLFKYQVLLMYIKLISLNWSTVTSNLFHFIQVLLHQTSNCRIFVIIGITLVKVCLHSLLPFYSLIFLGLNFCPLFSCFLTGTFFTKCQLGHMYVLLVSLIHCFYFLYACSFTFFYSFASIYLLLFIASIYSCMFFYLTFIHYFYFIHMCSFNFLYSFSSYNSRCVIQRPIGFVTSIAPQKKAIPSSWLSIARTCMRAKENMPS